MNRTLVTLTLVFALVRSARAAWPRPRAAAHAPSAAEPRPKPKPQPRPHGDAGARRPSSASRWTTATRSSSAGRRTTARPCASSASTRRRRGTSSTTCPTPSRSGPRPAPSRQGAFAAATQVELLRSSTLDPYGRTLGYLFLNGRNYSVLVVGRASRPRPSPSTATTACRRRRPRCWPRRRRPARCPSSRPTCSARACATLEVDEGERARGRAVGPLVKTPHRRLLLPLGLAAASSSSGQRRRLPVPPVRRLPPRDLARPGGRAHRRAHRLDRPQPDEGGVCLTRGGWPFLMLNAGYLGSLLWGALFLLLGARRRAGAAGGRRRRRLHPRGHPASTCAPGSASSTAWPPGSCSWPSRPAPARGVRGPPRGHRGDQLLYAVWDVASDVLCRHSGAERRRRARAPHRHPRPRPGASRG